MKLLRSKRGASLVFVMVSMFFLLALGTAAFTAAGLSHGVNLAQRDRNQLDLYVSSMERTIKAVLEQAWTPQAWRSLAPPATRASILYEHNTLGGRVLLDAYTSSKNPLHYGPLARITIEPGDVTLPGGFVSTPGSLADGVSQESVKYTISIIVDSETFHVVSMPFNRCERRDDVLDDDGNIIETIDPYCMPLVVTMSGEIRVVIHTEYTTPVGEVLSMTTTTTYRVHNIRLEETGIIITDPITGIESHSCDVYEDYAVNLHEAGEFNPPADHRMIIESEAIWEVIRHERSAAASAVATP